MKVAKIVLISLVLVFSIWNIIFLLPYYDNVVLRSLWSAYYKFTPPTFGLFVSLINVIYAIATFSVARKLKKLVRSNLLYLLLSICALVFNYMTWRDVMGSIFSG